MKCCYISVLLHLGGDKRKVVPNPLFISVPQCANTLIIVIKVDFVRSYAQMMIITVL